MIPWWILRKEGTPVCLCQKENNNDLTTNKSPPRNNLAVCHSVTRLRYSCIIPRWWNVTYCDSFEMNKEFLTLHDFSFIKEFSLRFSIPLRLRRLRIHSCSGSILSLRIHNCSRRILSLRIHNCSRRISSWRRHCEWIYFTLKCFFYIQRLACNLSTFKAYSLIMYQHNQEQTIFAILPPSM
jgi:hypothetical protein